MDNMLRFRIKIVVLRQKLTPLLLVRSCRDFSHSLRFILQKFCVKMLLEINEKNVLQMREENMVCSPSTIRVCVSHLRKVRRSISFNIASSAVVITWGQNLEKSVGFLTLHSLKFTRKKGPTDRHTKSETIFQMLALKWIIPIDLISGILFAVSLKISAYNFFFHFRFLAHREMGKPNPSSLTENVNFSQHSLYCFISSAMLGQKISGKRQPTCRFFAKHCGE